jgi:aminocarboxymuconate-semialdehyde decarboxylase
MLRLLLKSVGPERIALGTDYPFPLGEPIPGALIESLPRLSKAVKRRLLAENALEFLGLGKAGTANGKRKTAKR